MNLERLGDNIYRTELSNADLKKYAESIGFQYSFLDEKSINSLSEAHMEVSAALHVDCDFLVFSNASQKTLDIINMHVPNDVTVVIQNSVLNASYIQESLWRNIV